MPDDAAASETQYCTFYVGEGCYGIDVELVRETLQAQEVTPVPLAPKSVLGIINIRGDILTAVDLRSRLDVPEREGVASDGGGRMHVIVDSSEGPVSFVVDRIGDVLTVAREGYEPPPSTLDGAAKNLIVGAYKLEDKLLLVLDSYGAAEVWS